MPLADGNLLQDQVIEVHGQIHPSVVDNVYFGFQDTPTFEVTSTVPVEVTLDFQKRRIYRNAYQESEWGTHEEYGPFPFVAGEKFNVTFDIRSTECQVAVNGTNIFKFVHRMPLSFAKYFYMEGEVTVDSVKIGSK